MITINDNVVIPSKKPPARNGHGKNNPEYITHILYSFVLHHTPFNLQSVLYILLNAKM